LIVCAYRQAAALGLAVWTQDEAGPFQTVPYAGQSWQPEAEPKTVPHEYVRNGTAKVLTLFQPLTGQVRVKGVTSGANAVLHPWLKDELGAIVASLPPVASDVDAETNRTMWERWRTGLSQALALPENLPRLRGLLVWDNLTGHKTASMVEWLIQHGIMPLYTPLGGSWLNMAESIQRILKRRALDGQYPTEPAQIMSWFEAVAVAWNREPTPFEWGGKRGRHAVGGSGAATRRLIPRPRRTTLEKWQQTCQVTH